MWGKTTSRNRSQAPAPASLAASSCEGGTALRAAEKSSIENAVPRQVLKTMIEAIGYSSSQAVPGLCRIALSVPPPRLRKATHRKATMELGRIHARRTSVSTTTFTGVGTLRMDDAMRNPMTVCPTIAEPKTKTSVRTSERRNAGSATASV